MQNLHLHQEDVNLHTHSFYCGHGCGTISEYVQEAAKNSIALLGMSEHCPVPDDRWQKTRMDYDQIASYEADCQKAKEQFAGQLVVATGYECDYLARYHQYYKEVKDRVDYLIFAIHDLASEDTQGGASVFYGSLTKEDLHTYTDLYCKGLSSGLFLFGAHPDLFAYSYYTWDAEAKACSKAIIECAISNNVALEINANGMRKPAIRTEEGHRFPYPLSAFWEMAAEYPIKVVTNSDAHNPALLRDRFEDCSHFAEDHNLQFCSYDLEITGQNKYSISLS